MAKSQRMVVMDKLSSSATWWKVAIELSDSSNKVLLYSELEKLKMKNRNEDTHIVSFVFMNSCGENTLLD